MNDILIFFKNILIVQLYIKRAFVVLIFFYFF